MNSISLSESLPDRMRLRRVGINCFRSQSSKTFAKSAIGFDFGTDTKSGSARFWNTHQPAYPEPGLHQDLQRVENCSKFTKCSSLAWFYE